MSLSCVICGGDPSYVAPKGGLEGLLAIEQPLHCGRCNVVICAECATPKWSSNPVFRSAPTFKCSRCGGILLDYKAQ